MQTGAHDYALLVVGRFIGGIGVGMLCMVVPMYVENQTKVSLHSRSLLTGCLR